MKTSKEAICILNDLIRVNNDRNAGYRKAGEELKDEDIDLRVLFNQYAIDSKIYANRLQNILIATNTDVSEDTSISGQIYKAWMDVKITFSGHDRASVLSACEYGEESVQKAYTTAMESEAVFADFIYDIMEDQQFSLKEVYKMIRLKKNELAAFK
ncbi:MAG: PA2169 family four-helix-bundle protein [Cytophagales bacterium]|nr:PA2169 family four-helix-bundle protein [Cytophaga sp.]